MAPCRFAMRQPAEPMALEAGGRLNGWKAIAAFLAVDVRTARRWEAERALPVHRLPGDARSPVWADKGELAAWLRPPQQGAPAPAQEPPPALPTSPPAVPTPSRPAPAPLETRPRRRLVPAILALAAAAALTLLLSHLLARPAPPSAGPAYADASAERRHRDALHALASRTPRGLDQAATLFAANARAHPDNPAAFTGLAETLLLMREFAGLPDEPAYRRARNAAERALALAPDDPAALRALAFTLFWSEADKPRALALFARAAARAPADARTHHWRGNALVFAGLFAEGLESLARARALAPESSAIAADEAHIRFLLAETPGARADALAALRRITEVDPAYIGAWRYLEWDLLAAGDAPGFLAAARAHARLADRPARLETLAAAEAALATGGRPALIAALLAAARARHRETRADALTLARLHALAGNQAESARWLARAQALGEPHAFMPEGWPELRPLMKDPQFAAEFAGAAPSRPLPPAQTPSP